MIDISEVGPRDGLQNESKILTTEQKKDLIEKLISSGIQKIEAVSFVNPKVVPQMADAEELMHLLPSKEGMIYAGLVLSRSGLERALNTKVDNINIVLATSDTFNLKNARRTVKQSLEEQIEVIKDTKKTAKIPIGILGTAFGCPYEGMVPFDHVLNIAESFLEAGCKEITLADTTGMANPQQIEQAVTTFYEKFGKDTKLGLHFHNTRGLGLANTLAGFQAGVRNFDSSIAGLGGCPFAPKAVGNVCTEDIVHMFHQMGLDTGVNLEGLIDTTHWMEEQMGRELPGMVAKAGIAK